MNSILYALFQGEYEINMERGKEQQELGKKLCEEWEKIQKVMGIEFVDQLGELEGEEDNWRAFHYYQAGFRLGVRLMLEALGL